MTLDLRRLKYIQAVDQHGSLTRAAEALGVAQPALSHHISALEEHFKTELFHRTPRGMVTTDVGKILVAHAASILRSVEDAEAATLNGVDTPTGSVALGLLNTLALRLAVPLFQRCSEAYPNIRLFIAEGTSQSLHEGMQRQELDLAINLSEAAESSAKLLATERLVLLSKKTDGAETGDISLREALSRPLILPSRNHVLRKIVEWAAQQQDFKMNIRYELAGGWILKSAVVAGLGDTIIGRAAVMDEDLATQLMVRPIISPMLERRLVLVHSPVRETAPAVIAVTGLLRELVREVSNETIWKAAVGTHGAMPSDNL